MVATSPTILILKNKNMKITVYREPSKKELEAISKAKEILDQVGLKLIGTRPKDR